MTCGAATSVIWHDLECGGYREDLPLWRELAAAQEGAVLDIGAGTGRVSLDLARRGFQVTALERDAHLLEALVQRAEGLGVNPVLGDARDFDLRSRFALCVVPMQTVQLLGGRDGRSAFLACARAHLAPDGILAMAIVTTLDPFSVGPGEPGPLPDSCEVEGTVFWSRPTAVRADRTEFVLERRRELVAPGGEHTVEENVIRLDRVGTGELEREGRAVGLRRLPARRIPSTSDHVGSEVVVLAA